MARLQKARSVCDYAKVCSAGGSSGAHDLLLTGDGNGKEVHDEEVFGKEGDEESNKEISEEECGWWPGLLAGIQARSGNKGWGQG
jgi:hypothetical protein